MTRRFWWVTSLCVVALAVAASASSIGNGFAYDDVYLIERASRMHTLDGWWREFTHTYWPEGMGGDGYRPFVIIGYRLQWAIAEGSALPFHVVNVVVHVATAVAVLWLGAGMLPPAAAAIVAALYAVHPVHVEAVANVVGQAELWVALLVTIAMALYVHGRSLGPITRRRWFGIGVLYAAGMLFKEHAIVLPALILLAEFTIVHDRTPARARLTTLRLPILVLTVVACAYLWARSVVVVSGISGFEPYVVFQALRLSTPDRILTMIGATPEWLRLFLWPARLMTEYSPPYLEVAQGPSVSQLPGLLVLLGVIGLALACWRRSPVTTFGIGWVILALLPASNFIVPAGFIIAERTLLLPSVGAMLAVGSAIPWLYSRVEHRPALRWASALLVIALVGLGLGRSHTRNRVWHDTETLFRQGVRDAPDSYRAHFMLGAFLFDKGSKVEAERHYAQATHLFPHDPLIAYSLADQYTRASICGPAIPLYRWLFEREADARGRLGFAYCLLLTNHPDEARQQALHALRNGASLRDARRILQAARAARDTAAARAARSPAQRR